MHLTADHQPAPPFVIRDGLSIPTAPLIARGETAKLAALGLHPAAPDTEPAPLGYTPYQLVDGVYVREPAGTPEQRADIIRRENLRTQWAEQAQGRATREARRTLAQAPTPETLNEHIVAVRLLAGV